MLDRWRRVKRRSGSPGLDPGRRASTIPGHRMGASRHIEIRRLRVRTFIGVPEEERADAQELLLTVRIVPRSDFAAMADQIDRTIDYAALAAEIQALALAKPRRLIETLADDVADHVLANPAASGVEVMVEKFILPDTECVAVSLKKERSA
jgi:FolB domain-containing protein